jgi:glycosyltransferase involved in cell wall biosynthesis
MKIAFIVPYVPNQVRTRSYNLITQLSRHGHEVDVFTVGAGAVDIMDAEALRSRSRTVHYYEQPVWRSLINSVLAIPSGKPLQAVYSRQPELIRQLARLFKENGRASEYDIVHIEHLRGSEYGRFLKSHSPSLPVVWDSVDCISHLFRQAAGQSTSLFGKLVSRFELGRTEKTEADLLEIFDHVLVTSSTDRNALMDTIRDGRTHAPISVLSNGVDQDYFRPNPDLTRNPETLIFSGKMSYHANISMVKYLVNGIMPLIWRQRPNVQLLVVGKDPSSEIKKMAENPLITVTGTVSDIRPFLWKSTVAVAPLVYGAGVQNKILEAMAVELPVVTTSRAVVSLCAVPGRQLLTGDTPQEFSAGVLSLLENANLRQEIGKMGRLYVEENHNWIRVSEQLVQIYSQLLLPQSGARVDELDGNLF